MIGVLRKHRQIRLCLFGDSHLAALKRHWLDIGHPGHAIDPLFIPGVRDHLTGMEAREGRLYPLNDQLAWQFFSQLGGADQLDPGNFDAFVVIGLRLRFQRAIVTTRQFSVHGQGKQRRLISEAALAAMMHDSLRQSAAFTLVRILREATDKRILVLPQAMPAESFGKRRANRALDAGGIKAAYRATSAAIERLFAPLDVEIVAQDPETFAGNGLTQDAYTVGSVRMIGDRDELHDTTDHTHMNPQYGAVQLRQIQAVLADSKAVS